MLLSEQFIHQVSSSVERGSRMHRKRSLFWDLFDASELEAVAALSHSAEAGEAEDAVIGLVSHVPYRTAPPRVPLEEHVWYESHGLNWWLVGKGDRVPAIFIELVIPIILTTNNIFYSIQEIVRSW